MGEKITIHDLIERIVQKNKSTKKFTDEFLHELPRIIEKGLKEDGVVRLKGLGIYKLNWVNTRQGRNIQSGEVIEIPGHNKIIFIPEKSLRDLVNKPYNNLKPKLLWKKEEVIEKKEEVVKPKKKRKKAILYWLLLIPILIILIILFSLINFNNKQNTGIKKEMCEFSQNHYKPKDTKPVVVDTVENDSFNDDHIIKPGDNLSKLAEKYYGDADLWPIIYNANKNKIKDPDIIFSDQQLKIPDFSNDEIGEKEKKEITNAFEAASEAYKMNNKPDRAKYSNSKAKKYLQ